MEAGWSALELMDQQERADEVLTQPFKVADAEHPDLIVEAQDPSFSACAVVAAVEQMPTSWTKSKEPHVNSISKMFEPAKKTIAESTRRIEKSKTIMTPKRLLLFILGFFVAAIAGSISNWMIADSLENISSPEYVKAFHDAEESLDSAQESAFTGMEESLKAGEKIEPNSHRFTLLTANLAKHLDESGRYLEAKAKWARAAVPTFSAAPDLRELKRSYLIDEARSEHRAYASQMKNEIDLNLLNQLEEAATVFRSSSSTDHRFRAIEAYQVAGSLAADANNFERSEKNFHLQELAGSNPHSSEFFFSQTSFQARWLAHLQKNVHELLLSKARPFPRSQYKPASWRATYDRLDSALKARQWSKVEKVLEDAQNAHLQDVYGFTILTDLYSIDHDWNEDGKGNEYETRLNEWLKKPHSPRALVAAAIADTKLAVPHLGEVMQTITVGNFIESSNRNALQALQSGLEIAYEPSIIDAIQNNFYTGEKWMNWSFPTKRVISDLRAASIRMTGDDTRVSINELIADTEKETLSNEDLVLMVERTAAKANEIGGQAGDKFYTRAIWTIGTERGAGLFDDERFARGTSLLKKEFGYTLDDIP